MRSGEMRAGPGFRVRCPEDDGTTAHLAVDLHGRVDLDVFARLVRALKRCTCGAELAMLGSDAPEPKDANAARLAAVREAVEGGLAHTRVKHGRSADVLRAVFRDGREHTNREVAAALGLGDHAVAKMLARSPVVERVSHGVWKLRDDAPAGSEVGRG
jgi:hypothetical protein